MRFGKIEYLNLAPFDVFIKKYPTHGGFKLFLNHHKSYPAKLNKEFLFKRIDAGFISSIAGKNAKKTHSAIIANGAVWSVIVIKKAQKLDYQSASSNALAQILNIKGEVLIGDRALRYKLKHDDYIDLGEEWAKNYRLPFIFGIFCANSNYAFYDKISRAFNQKNIKIPQYLLKNYAKNSQISERDIRKYLTRIHYKISPKSRVSLFRFYRATRIKKIKTPKRF